VDERGIALIHLVLSLDYEVFGNGAGDVMRDVVYPTRRLLEICERHGAKMTIMFEVGEYWAFEQYDALLRRDLGYSPGEQMREQAADATRRGHDVQLHLHPQWIGAEYGGKAWQLRNSCWRLADLPNGLGCEDQVTSIIGSLYRGRQTLEDMVKPVKADYQCICFRAGGFYAQPSGDIIHAMKRVGLKVDSSVVKGYRTTAPFTVDYSRVHTNKMAWWTTDADFTEEGPPGESILELPVSSKMEPYWKSFKPAKLRAALRRRQIEHAANDGNAGGESHRISSVPSLRMVLKKMLTRHASTFDFCKLSCNDMLKRLQEFDDRRPQPVVAIGHSKDFVNDRHFDRFLAAASQSRRVCLTSMSECVREALGGAGLSSSAAHVAACHDKLISR